MSSLITIDSIIFTLDRHSTFKAYNIDPRRGEIYYTKENVNSKFQIGKY